MSTVLNCPIAVPAAWPLVRLRDVAIKVGSGATPRGGSRVYLPKRRVFALIRSQNVFDRHFDASDIAFIDDDAARRLSSVAVRENDVLLNITGDGITFSRACMAPSGVLPAVVNQHVAIIRTDPTRCDSRFLLAFLTHPVIKNYIESFNTGASRRAITKGAIESFVLPLPGIGVQRAVGDILSAYDDLIENNKCRIAVAEEMARALFREWFVENRFPGHARVRMVESKIGKVPAHWPVTALSTAVEIDPRTTVPKTGAKPFVPMGSLSETSMIITSVERREGNSGSKFKNGDTLLARITPCLENGKTGFVSFLSKLESVAVGSTEFIVLRNRSLCPEYVYLVARSDELREHAIKSMSGATGRQRVRSECFDTFLIAQPDVSTMKAFRELTSPMFREVDVLAQKNEVLRATRDLLLPRVVSGEVDVANMAALELADGPRA